VFYNAGGISINAVSSVILVMSIGLMVDFLVHVLMKYYESDGNRREKTINMMRTMGSSILVGGISTFLGTLPLLFSKSHIFKTVLVAFLGLTTLGVGHGLILLPVLLATFGTEEVASTKGHHGLEGPLVSTVPTDEEGSGDDNNHDGAKVERGTTEPATSDADTSSVTSGVF
jgi:uncharacterized membrane protein YdfJ with MMPL/SSD domain